jgi:hypothetical protein
MEKLVDTGIVRHIGTSNMTIPKLELLLRDARIRPAVNEMELHPHFQQPALFNYLLSHGIQPIGYSPIGSPARPDRDRSPEDTADIEDPVIVAIARRLPPWLSSDHLTVLGLLSMPVAGLAFSRMGTARWSATALALAVQLSPAIRTSSCLPNQH